MAFVHPVKTLKDPALFTFWNADSIVYHTVKRMSLTVSDHDTHMPILFCITDRIIRNVKKHFIQYMADALDFLGISSKFQGYIFLFRRMTEIVLYIFRKLIKVHFLKRNFTVAFIQSGQLYDICYQIGQTHSLMINPSGKFLYMICRNHSVHHQLRISGNGHQRRFQLMGYIGRKFFPDFFGLFQLFYLLPDLTVLLIHPHKKGA